MKRRGTRNRSRRRVVLIFGDPNAGKSHLASQLREAYGYDVLSLDETYVEFVKERFPDLYLPALRDVIAQHFQTMLQGWDSGAASRAWREHVASVVEARSRQHFLLAVEGFLLLPALADVQARLASKATVTTVEARARQYFVASSIEEIHGR